MDEPLIAFSRVSKRFCRRPELRARYCLSDVLRELRGIAPRDELRPGEFWALRDVDFELRAGETVGVIGHNGSGKSTLMSLADGGGLPTTGSITFRTSDVCRVDHLGTISPYETGRENVMMQLALHEIPRDQTEAEIEAVAQIADLKDRLDEVVGNYSNGMRGRLGFAIYSRLRPDVLIVDETIGAGDLRFRDRFRTFLGEFAASGGAVLLSMHDSNVITTLCDRAILLDEGRVVTTADPATAIDAYNELASRKGRPPMPKPRARPATSAAATPPALAVEGRLHVAAELVGDGAPIPGGEIEIAVTVEASEPLRNVSLGLELGRGDFSPIAKCVGEAGDLPSGTTRRTCRIVRVPFVAGRYEARAWVLDRASWRQLAQSEVLPVVIGRPTDEPTRRDAIVQLESSWNAAAAIASRETSASSVSSPARTATPAPVASESSTAATPAAGA